MSLLRNAISQARRREAYLTQRQIQKRVKCSVCGGTGRVPVKKVGGKIAYYDPCSNCEGKGYVPE